MYHVTHSPANEATFIGFLLCFTNMKPNSKSVHRLIDYLLESEKETNWYHHFYKQKERGKIESYISVNFHPTARHTKWHIATSFFLMDSKVKEVKEKESIGHEMGDDSVKSLKESQWRDEGARNGMKKRRGSDILHDSFTVCLHLMQVAIPKWRIVWWPDFSFIEKGSQSNKERRIVNLSMKEDAASDLLTFLETRRFQARKNPTASSMTSLTVWSLTWKEGHDENERKEKNPSSFGE